MRLNSVMVTTPQWIKMMDAKGYKTESIYDMHSIYYKIYEQIPERDLKSFRRFVNIHLNKAGIEDTFDDPVSFRQRDPGNNLIFIFAMQYYFS
jgi:hypothetical protein